MRITISRFVVVVFVCLFATHAWSQGSAENIARSYTLDPKPGMGPQLEAALQAHLEWRRAHDDPWTWTVLQVVNGDDFGQFIVRSAGHRWADLDAYDRATVTTEGNQHFTTTVAPFLESFTSRITQVNDALSRPPASTDQATMFAVVNYEVRIAPRFYASLASFKQAAEQTDYPLRHILLDVANGGPAGAILVRPASSWSDLAPPDTTIPELMSEVYGPEEAAAIGERFGSSVRSVTSSVVLVRRDLMGS